MPCVLQTLCTRNSYSLNALHRQTTYCKGTKLEEPNGGVFQPTQWKHGARSAPNKHATRSGQNDVRSTGMHTNVCHRHTGACRFNVECV